MRFTINGQSHEAEVDIRTSLLDLAREVESYYLTSFSAALSLVCPPTGALKVVRQYELTAGGRAAREAGASARHPPDCR